MGEPPGSPIFVPERGGLLAGSGKASVKTIGTLYLRPLGGIAGQTPYRANGRFEASAWHSGVLRVGPFVAVSRRLGDEIHPWPLNGDLRP